MHVKLKWLYKYANLNACEAQLLVKRMNEFKTRSTANKLDAITLTLRVTLLTY